MRVTNNMLSENYLKNLNSTLEQLNNSNTRLAAKRKYMRFAEDPSTALKAMQIRKNLTRIDVYTKSLTDVNGVLDQYETSISNINDLVKEAVAQVMQGTTGTSGSSVEQTVANTLRGYQESILAAANAKYADDFIFGGNEVGEAPFTISSTGELLYKGVNVDTGTFEDEYRYIDIGLGLKYDASGNLSSKVAFNIANSGAKLLGTGVDANGVSNNLYNLIGQIADKLESGDTSDMKLYTDKLNDLAEHVRLQYVNIGEKSNFVSYMKDRLESEKINASKKQNDLEVLDTAEGIIEFSELEFAYNACLSMGSKLLQPSLLDYLR
jgi:flagellar hook-associated protein 3 FlgL